MGAVSTANRAPTFLPRRGLSFAAAVRLATEQPEVPSTASDFLGECKHLDSFGRNLREGLLVDLAEGDQIDPLLKERINRTGDVKNVSLAASAGRRNAAVPEDQPHRHLRVLRAGPWAGKFVPAEPEDPEALSIREWQRTSTVALSLCPTVPVFGECIIPIASGSNQLESVLRQVGHLARVIEID